jgi:DNA mismatch repair protein MutS
MSELEQNNYKIIIADEDSDIRIIDMYFECQAYYTKVYGPKAIIFMQDGKFYESFSTEAEGCDLRKIEDVLQVKLTKRGKNSNKKDPRSKPNMLGFPLTKLFHSIKTLINNAYTVIVFEERKTSATNKHGKPVIERHQIGVFSPGTFVTENQTNANYIISVFIVEEPQLKRGTSLMAIGITLIDTVTGNSIIHEFYSDKNDENMGLDELIRIMKGFQPTETIIYYHPMQYDATTVRNIKSYLELDNVHHSFIIYDNSDKNTGSIKSKDLLALSLQSKGCKDSRTGTEAESIKSKDSRTGAEADHMKLLNPQSFKINYQNDFFASIYNFQKQVKLNKKSSPLENLGIERKPYVAISLIILIKYLTEHNINLLKNLSIPNVYNYNKHLILGNNAVEQLNIIDSHNLEVYDKKIDSLFSVINKTVTPMGKRFLRHNLINPLSLEEKPLIQKRYDIIDRLIKSKKYVKIHLELKNIYDIERYHRKIALGTINPYEFNRLDHFYKYVSKIIKIVSGDEILSKIIPSTLAASFEEYKKCYKGIFNVDVMQKYHNFSELSESIFTDDYDKNISKLSKKINLGMSVVTGTKELFTKLIKSESDESKKKKNIIINEKVKIECGDSQGYHFSVNKTNEKILKNALKDSPQKLKGKAMNDEVFTVLKDSIKFKQQKGKTKIFVKSISEHTDNLDESIVK